MRFRALAFLTALVTIGLFLTTGKPPAAAGAEPFEDYRLSNLRVAGGTGSWAPENDFQLDWDLPPDPILPPPIESISYLIRDLAGNQIGDQTTLFGKVAAIRKLQISPPPGLAKAPPGRYSVEIWGWGDLGSGPHASIEVRFDDVRPGPAQPLDPGGWIRAGTEAVLRIGHPPAPLPISGIRGYAIVVDHGSGGAPCAGPDRCTEAETDLHAGIGGDSISLGVLPEGFNQARVVAVSNSGMRSRAVGSVDLRVDGTKPTVTLAGAPDGWSSRPVQLTATATDAQSGMAPAGPGGPFTAIAVDNGPPTTAAGSAASAIVHGEGVHRVRFYGRDAAGNSGGDEAVAGSVDVRIDETPPRVSFAAGQDRSEPERIEATVADPLSGPGAVAGSIAVRAVGSTAQFTPIPTRVSAGQLTAHWESDSYPRRSYEFRATGYDAAGNPASATRRADGTRMVLANPLKQPTRIEFGFGGRRMVWHRCRQGRNGVRCHRQVIASFERRPSSRAARYGRRVPVAGRLLSTTGSPLPGQPVTLVEHFATGATDAQRTTVVQTSSDGTFLAQLPPGPSRSVEALFAGTVLLTRADSRAVELAVGTAIHLRTSAGTAKIGGPAVIFSGRIAGAEARVPAAGRPVEPQFRVGDTPWSQFRTIQTDARGRFRYPYSFSDDDSRGVRFQFRAYAPTQPGWPYAPGTSRPVAVTGR